MTTTLVDVAKRKPVEQSAEAQAAAELVRMAKEQGLSLTGPDGLLKQPTKTVLETALNEELTEHLGYEKHDPAGAGSGNIRNGTRIDRLDAAAAFVDRHVWQTVVMQWAAPQRADELSHLSLDELRTYRAALAAEEDRVSYWRRILQGRLDTVRCVPGVRTVEAQRLAPLLSSAVVGRGRQAFVRVVPAEGIPPVPNLERLWESVQSTGGPAEQARQLAELEQAEQDLSVYRTAIHQRIAVATQEVVARYRERPEDCLSALAV